MRSLIGMLVVAALPLIARAQSHEEILAQAEAAFQRGVESKGRFLQAREHFSEATDKYKTLHEKGVRSSGLYRSVANAAYLADRWPEAIWAYQCGLQVDPNDNAMRAHLAIARARVLYPPSGEGRLEADTWPAWLHRPTRWELTCAFALAYALTWLIGTFAFVSQRASLWLIATLALLIACVAGAALWHAERQADLDQRMPVVIVASNTAFYRGNATSYPQHTSLPILPRGLEVRQIHRRGNWLQVRLTTGEVGWLPREQVLIVEP
jgi:hypothetical protein